MKTATKFLIGVSALVLSACAATSSAQTTSTVSESWPPAEGVETADAFTETGLAALDEAMRGLVDDGRVIGVQWMLVKDGAVAQHETYGVRDVKTKAPVTPDTIYRIYSMTKPITGVALMQLYEEGKFSLDDPITRFVPQFEDLKVLDGTNEDGTPILADLERPATMRELMSHTAGFAYGLGGADYANQQFREKKVLAAPDMATFIDRISGIPLLYRPGERWYYSAAVDVQGYIVEQLSGMPFDQYLETHVFEPLNMDDTGFYVPEEDTDRLADLMYFYTDPEKPEQPGMFVPIYTENVQFRESTVGFPSGGGGLVSTIDDYARFCQMMLEKGSLSGHQILKPETVALMTTNQLPEGLGVNFDGTGTQAPQEVLHKFGLDWGIIEDPEAAGSPAGKGTFYWGGAAGSWFWIDPENDLFFIGMIQRFGELPEEKDMDDMRAFSNTLVYEALAE